MPNLRAYHRPRTVPEALQLLTRPDTVVLAGGTQLIANVDEQSEEVVDLQAVGLDQIEIAPDAITFGAMVRLASVVTHPEVPEALRQLAHREGPNTFRRMSTVGGTVVAADWESELYAGLLVHDATVTAQTLAGKKQTPLAEFALDPGALVTSVTIRRSGMTAAERVARTPADKPIVAIIGRKDGTGAIRLAACGIAEKPVLVEQETLDQLDPPADFRGSADYRRQMATVLTERVLQELHNQDE